MSELRGTGSGGAMARRALRLMGILVACAAVTGPSRAAPRESGAIEFSGDLDGTLARARESGKPVLLAFHATWCPNCRDMAENTIPSPPVQALADRFHWVLIDIDRNVTVARKFGVYATPHFYVLDPRGRRRLRIVGVRDPEAFAELLNDVLVDLQAEVEDPELLESITGPSTGLQPTPKGYRGLAVCFSHVGYGPLNITSQSPFQSLRLGLVPRTPSTLARNQWDVKAAGTWVNVWAPENDAFEGVVAEAGSYFLDYEALDASVIAAYGVTDTLQLELEYEHRRRFGGGLDDAMDTLVQDFHDLTGFDQDGRTDVPKADFHFNLNPARGPSVSLGPAGKGTVARHVLFTIQHNVTCGTARYPAFAYAVTGRWSLESDDLEGSDFDYGLSISTSRRFGNLYGYFTLGYSMYGSDSFHGIELEDSQLSAQTALEWRYKPRISWLVQLLISEGAAADDFDEFSDPSFEITLGWKWEVAPMGVLEFGVIENLVTFDNSPDFGLHVGYSQRF